MEKEEALKQIESITEVINSNTKILLSAPHLIIIGILLCLVPLVNYLTKSLTFGMDMDSSIVIFINVIFYYLVFRISAKVVSNLFQKPGKSIKNPLIQKAFKIKYAFIVIFILGSTSLAFSGNSILIYPIIYILIGLLYNLIGQYSYTIVKILSWTYILAGISFIYLTSIANNNYLWVYFIIYMGISYIVMGAFILQHSNK